MNIHTQKRTSHNITNRAIWTCKAVLQEILTDYQESITKNDKYLPCEFCQLLFYNESQKIIHESLHNEKNKNIFPCLYCPQVTSSKIEIVEHHRQNHEREPLPYYFCDYQGRLSAPYSAKF